MVRVLTNYYITKPEVPANEHVRKHLSNTIGSTLMKEANINSIEIIIKNMMERVLSPLKVKTVETALENQNLPKQNQSMVVIIDKILDEHRKRKIPPFSHNWIRNN